MGRRKHSPPRAVIREGGAGTDSCGESERIVAQSPAVTYRCEPFYLATAEIAAELVWLADAPTWPGGVGRWARRRRDALRVELRRREAS
ncbi:hypothetical protein BH23CHL2_BH23CHL2_24950 [soil metagenome]